MRTLDDIYDEFELLDRDDRYRLLIDLGRSLESMPESLKTDSTRVSGCLSQVWVYPIETEDRRLHYLADSNTDITKGIIALVLMVIQDRPAREIADTDITEVLDRFNLKKQLSPNRTQGLPNMIALVREHAARIAAAG